MPQLSQLGLPDDTSQYASTAMILGGAVLAGLFECFVIVIVARWITRRWGGVLSRSLISRTTAPLLCLSPFPNLLVALPATALREPALSTLKHALWIAIILLITWLLTRLALVASDTVKAAFPINIADNRRARRMVTLVQILRQTATVVIVVIGISAAIMTFPQARSVGASMLASAGIAALVIGMAARPALSNIIAGVQIALAEPIALDDVVIVEGEWGRIEEITMTYVVVQVWDLRRLIIPLSHFIERPFQNWTRQNADLMGTVFVHTDFTVPVDSVRAELTRILEATALWDKKVNVVHVTDAVNGRLELRLLMSAASAPILWDLRCHVRERIIDFIRANYPGSLVRTRLELIGNDKGFDRAPAASDPRPGNAAPA